MLRQLCALAWINAILCVLATCVDLHEDWQRLPAQLLHSVVQLIGKLQVQASLTTSSL